MLALLLHLYAFFFYPTVAIHQILRISCIDLGQHHREGAEVGRVVIIIQTRRKRTKEVAKGERPSIAMTLSKATYEGWLRV